MLKKAGYAIVFALSGVWACDRTEPPVPERGRTVLIYMAADNSLDHYAVTNLKHIAEGMKGVGGRVLIYADRRYDVPPLAENPGRGEAAAGYGENVCRRELGISGNLASCA